MAKLTLTDPANFNATALSQIANNHNLIEAAVENTLSRNGTSPNQMEADFDMNNNDILNVGTLSVTEVLLGGESFVASRLIPAGGTTGQILAKSSATNYDTEWTDVNAGDMLKAAYDPNNVHSDVFDLANHKVLSQAVSAPSLRSRIADSINLLDYATTEAGRTALKNGTTGVKTAWDLAVADASARGIGTIDIPAGNYELDTNTYLTNPGLYVRGEPDKTRIYKNGYGRLFDARGTVPNTTTDGYALTANATAGATSVTLSTINAANFTAGQTAILWHDLATKSSASRDAEFVWITNVNTGTGVITFASPIFFAYNTANTAKLIPATLLEGVGYENLIVDWTDAAQTSPQRPPYFIDEVFASYFCRNPRFVNIASKQTINTTIFLHGCIDAFVSNQRGKNGYSDGTDLTDAYSYGIAEAGLNVGLVANSLQFERHRHAYTTLVGSSSDTGTFNGGHPFWSKISNGVHRNAKQAGWDTHDAGIGITFENLSTIGGVLAGFQIRSFGHRLYNCLARGIQQFSAAEGHGLYLVGGDATSLWCRDTRINGFEAYDVAGHGIRDQSPGTIGRNITVESAQGNIISWSGSASGDGEYSGINGKDVAKNAAVGGAYAVAIGNASAQKNPRIRDLFVSDPNNNLTAVVNRGNISTNKVELTNVRGLNSSNAPIVPFASVTNTGLATVRGGYGSGNLNVSPIETVTLASDSFSASERLGSAVVIAPESGAADTLTTITTSERDGYIEIWGSTGNSFTITHGSGTNALFLKGAVNATLAQNQGMGFRRRSTLWFEMWRSF